MRTHWLSTMMLAACGSGGMDSSTDAGGDARGDATPSSVELAWFSDWRSGTGNDQAALYDGGKWDDQLCNADVLDVVAATGLDFPTTNVLRVTYDDPSRCLMLRALDRWPEVAIGEYMFVRVYYRNAMPDGTVVGFPHPLHIGEASPYTMWVNFIGPDAGVSPMTLQLAGTHEYPDRGWSYAFTTQQTYRLELRLHRTSETTAKVSTRVYDAANALVGENAAWHNGDTNQNSRTLAESDPTVEVANGGFQLLEIGNNDPAGLVGGPERYIYFGAVGVAIGPNADAWPGAYPTASEAL